MRRKIISVKRWIFRLMTLMLLFSLLPLSSPVFANPGLTVTNAALVANVYPGQKITHKMKVSIAAKQTVDGGYELLDASTDTGAYSAREYITVDESTIHLEPSGSREVVATISVPQDVGEGGKYAVIDFTTVPAPGSGVKTLTAVNVPIYLTVKDTELIHQGEIVSLSTSEVTSDKPVIITTSYRNTGNHHYKVKGEMTIRDQQGNELGAVPIALTTSSILPGMVRDLRVSFIPKAELEIGTYNITSRIMLENGSLLDESESTFQVKAPYVPPPGAGRARLSPSSSTVLESEDGRISISFPQGAVTAPVELSLTDIAPQALHVALDNMTLTDMCWRVDGVDQPLLKEAVITVKYGAEELMKADGESSVLKLVHLDKDDGPWAVSVTTANKRKMTLSTGSKQMGVWAVAVVPSTGNVLISLKTIVIMSSVIAVAVGLIIFLLLGRKKQRGKSG
jgi:hypothetical protein